MQKIAIDLINKIFETDNKEECAINVLNLMLVLKNLTLSEFEEVKRAIL